MVTSESSHNTLHYLTGCRFDHGQERGVVGIHFSFFPSEPLRFPHALATFSPRKLYSPLGPLATSESSPNTLHYLTGCRFDHGQERGVVGFHPPFFPPEPLRFPHAPPCFILSAHYQYFSGPWQKKETKTSYLNFT